MIRLRSDYLVFVTSGGEEVPYSAELVTIELLGEFSPGLQVTREASESAVRYFRKHGRKCVTVKEFATVIERILVDRGYACSVSGSLLPIFEGDSSLN